MEKRANKRIIFIKTVTDKTGLNRMTIWRYVKAGKFPKPSKIENRNAWLEEAVDQWIDEKMGLAKKQKMEAA